MKGGREKGSVGVAGRRQGPYFSPGTHSNNVPSHSSLELISAQASVAWEWESCRCQRESCLVPTWRQIEKMRTDQEAEGGRQKKCSQNPLSLGHWYWASVSEHKPNFASSSCPHPDMRLCALGDKNMVAHCGIIRGSGKKTGQRKQPGQCKFQGLPGGALEVHEHWWSQALSSSLQLVITPV